MDARFRIRTVSGEQIEPRTLDVFSELVRSGVIHPRDLVFDVLTGEWTPAEFHPMVRLLRDPLAADPGGAPPPAEDLPALDLVDVPIRSPEEEARAFIRRMDEERRSDPDLPVLAADLPLVDVRAPGVASVLSTLDAGPDGSGPEVGPTPPELPRGRVARRGKARWAPQLLGVVVFAGVLVPAAVAWGGRRGPPAPQPAAARGVPVPEADARAAALGRFVTAVEAVRASRGIGAVPDAWLEGAYLAEAARYPEVARYWAGFGAFVAEVRQREDELYRRAYLEVSPGAEAGGAVRALRMAGAVEAFQVAFPEREAVYARMEEVAAAAVALHAVLVELDGRVRYSPIRGSGVSADPVLEAAGADPEAQALLEVALDRVLRSLLEPDGSGSRSRESLPGWLADELAAVAATAGPPGEARSRGSTDPSGSGAGGPAG